MVISHNMMALNAFHMYGKVSTSQKKSTEKLSSGYRINRAADDAAGLTISEKMRSQIRGLNQGSDNIQDGISLIKIADGALDEVCDILGRMKELSIKAYNGTNTDADRATIQREIDDLIKEVDRTAESTEFNTLPLLKGNLYFENIIHHKAEEPHMVYTIAKGTFPNIVTSASSNKMALGTMPFTQDTSGYMNQTVYDGSGKILNGNGVGAAYVDGSYYCGPVQDDEKYSYGGVYTYRGSWTASSDNNYQQYVDFSGIANIDDAEELYSTVMALSGSSMSFESPSSAGGSSGYINFKYSSDSVSMRPYGSFDNECTVELKGILDNISSLYESQYYDKVSTDAEKKTAVKSLAAECVKSIVDEIENNISGKFLKTYRTNDSSIVLYDYRDAEMMKNHSEKDVKYSKIVQVGELVYEEWDEIVNGYNPISIACSSQAPFGDTIDINLRDISASSIGVKGYNISRVEEKVVKTYSEEYKKKLDDYNKEYNKYLNEYKAYE